MKRIILFLFVLFFTFRHLFADLKENDTRLKSIRKKITEGKSNNSIFEIKLNFEKYYGNFLVFYDYRGESIYLKYRENEWDKKNETLVSSLTESASYRVKFKVNGTLSSIPEKYFNDLNKLISDEKSKEIEKKETRKIREPINILVGEFILLKNAEMDDLIY
ncbi:MAG: hypothetical protein OEZ22_05565 [Spirochaetia bacterium]|nr:hypothetical protein [Spirochaetia bacterium]